MWLCNEKYVVSDGDKHEFFIIAVNTKETPLSQWEYSAVKVLSDVFFSFVLCQIYAGDRSVLGTAQ